MRTDLPPIVTVWRVCLNEDCVSPGVSLSDDEQARAAGFRFETDRRRFVRAHTAKRAILADCVQTAPELLEFATGKNGKPELVHGGDLRFNMSHSGELALFAICLGHAVGVDVELRERIERGAAWLEKAMSTHERGAMLELPENMKNESLSRLWVCKEAWIKATGEGLSQPLDSFDVSISSNGEAQLLATRPNPADAADWSLKLVEVGQEYVAAVAAKAPQFDIQLRDWPQRADG